MKIFGFLARGNGIRMWIVKGVIRGKGTPAIIEESAVSMSSTALDKNCDGVVTEEENR